jgi:indolepyruvate ferredoxin oxidoreductase beta subunit
MKDINILIAGVGGQGALLASKLLGALFLMYDMDVKVNEVHGMSQRGGSVITTVRAGAKVHSPLIVPGECDILIAMEQLEALRWSHYLSKTGKLVASTLRILPANVDENTYPKNIPEQLPGLWVDAQAIAKQAGNIRSANTALLGAASRYMDFSMLQWSQVISETLPQKAVSVNVNAFELGSIANLPNQKNTIMD